MLSIWWLVWMIWWCLSVIQNTWKQAIETWRCNVSPIGRTYMRCVSIYQTLFCCVGEAATLSLTICHTPVFTHSLAWHVKINHTHTRLSIFFRYRSRMHTINFIMYVNSNNGKYIWCDIFLFQPDDVIIV